ncbi:hypothetical protein, partial [Nocardia carnea]|uniref:hypothetical protein n=1 Tax=Nocardia carnea TaxID=37328 RepID=UPI003D778659
MTTTLIEPTTAPARPAPPPAGRGGLRRTLDNPLTIAYSGRRILSGCQGDGEAVPADRGFEFVGRTAGDDAAFVDHRDL